MHSTYRFLGCCEAVFDSETEQECLGSRRCLDWQGRWRFCVCRFKQQQSPLISLISLNLRIACATLVSPGTKLFLGGNYFRPGASSVCQPAHATRTDERSGARYSWTSAAAVGFFVYRKPNQQCPHPVLRTPSRSIWPGSDAWPHAGFWTSCSADFSDFGRSGLIGSRSQPGGSVLVLLAPNDTRENSICFDL